MSELTQAADGTWVATLKAPPVDGKANTELVGLVAKKRARDRKSWWEEYGNFAEVD